MEILHKICAALFAAVLVAQSVVAAENDVLYWMVEDSAQVQTEDGSLMAVADYFSSLGSAGADSSFAARVRVTGGDVTGDTFLNIYVNNGDGTWDLWADDLGVDFYDSGSGYWGAGVPTGNQSPSGDYSAGTPEYAFTVELGNIVWDAQDNGSWTTVATGETVNYSALADYISTTFDLNPPSGRIWSPKNFVAVPEPSGGMLFALGLAVLSLRRRRK